MPHYKLTYFDERGWAEPARQLFHLAHQPYDDVRISKIDGKEIKEKTPFGRLPVLSVDGLEIPESAAICRYLARKFGFAGKTPEEEALVDAVVELFKDFHIAFKTLVYAARAGKPAEEILQIRYEIFLPSRDPYFKILDGLLAKSESGFLVGDGLTWADLVVADNLHTLEKLNALETEHAVHRKLIEFKERIYATPDLQDHIATRPDTEI